MLLCFISFFPQARELLLLHQSMMSITLSTVFSQNKRFQQKIDFHRPLQLFSNFYHLLICLFFSVKAQSNNILSFPPPHHPPLTPSRMKSSKQHNKVIIVTVLKRIFQIQFWNINRTKGDEGRVKELWW